MTLIDIVSQCDELLGEIASSLSNLSPDVPSKMMESWKKQIRLQSYLHESISLLQIRDVVWETVKDMNDEDNRIKKSTQNQTTSTASPNVWTFNGKEIEFSMAKYLSMLSYTTMTWTIYDNLFNVVARMAAIPELASGTKWNPKLQALYDLKAPIQDEPNEGEKLSEKAKKFLFPKTVHDFAIEQYAWPCAFSYTIRNWLVHEGMNQGDCPLFKSDEILDGFIMSGPAKKNIETTLRKLYKEKDKLNSIWQKVDANGNLNVNLADMLEFCHSEIDSLFIALLPWSIESFEIQIKYFGIARKLY